MSMKVERLKEYRVAFRGLKEGIHAFHFVLDDCFFDCFEATQGMKGAVDAHVEVVKYTLLMELRIKIEGEVRATCDRCLDEVTLPVSGEMSLYLKEGEREAGNEDDFIVLSPEEDYLDLGTPLYELYMLSYPIRVVHPEGECNPEMERVLKEFVLDENKTIDPRWDELRKLINN